MIRWQTSDLRWRLTLFSLALLVNLGLNLPSILSENSTVQSTDSFVVNIVCSAASIGPASESHNTPSFFAAAAAPIISVSFGSKSTMGLLVRELFLENPIQTGLFKNQNVVYLNLFCFFSSLRDRGPPLKI